MVPGLALAWILARGPFRGKSLVETAVSLPLVLPPVATGLLLLELFGRRGPIGRVIEPIFGAVVFTPAAVVLAISVMSAPLLVRTARTAFEEVPHRLEQVARTLGAGERRVFWTVTLPLARRGIAAGLLLAFARGLGEFGATILVAGNIPGRTQTLSLAIYQAVQTGDDPRAWRLVGLSVAISFAAVLVAETRLGRRPRAAR